MPPIPGPVSESTVVNVGPAQASCSGESSGPLTLSQPLTKRLIEPTWKKLFLGPDDWEFEHKWKVQPIWMGGGVFSCVGEVRESLWPIFIVSHLNIDDT